MTRGSEKKVLVTGGARGLGRRLVEALAKREEYVVYLGCRRLKDGEAMAGMLGERVIAIQLDVTDRSSVSAAAAKLIEGGTQLDVLVNNAGVLLEREGVDLATIIEPTLTVNFDGVVIVTEAFLPVMHDGGLVINVSSGAGTRCAGQLSEELRKEMLDAEEAAKLRTLVARIAEEMISKPQKPGDTPVYNMSKTGLNYYTQLMARRHQRVRVNACSPGFCRTEIAGPSADYSKREPKDPALGVDVVVKLITGALGADTGRFYKECSKPGTEIEAAHSTEEAWIA